MSKAFIKAICSFLFVNSFGFHLFRWLNRNKLIILCYHRVTNKQEKDNVSIPGNCVDKYEFDKQMNFLKK